MGHSEELTITGLLKHSAGCAATLLAAFFMGDAFPRSQELFGGLWDFKSEYLLTLNSHIMHVCTRVGGRTVCTQVCTKVCAFPSSQTILEISVCWLIDASLIQFCQLRRTLPVSLALIRVDACSCSALLSFRYVIRSWMAHVWFSLIDFKRGGIKCLFVCFFSVT